MNQTALGLDEHLHKWTSNYEIDLPNVPRNTSSQVWVSEGRIEQGINVSKRRHFVITRNL